VTAGRQLSRIFRIDVCLYPNIDRFENALRKTLAQHDLPASKRSELVFVAWRQVGANRDTRNTHARITLRQSNTTRIT